MTVAGVLALGAAALLLAPAVAAGDLVVAEHGRSRWQIVTPGGSAPAVGYAAAELQDHLRKACGATLPIVREGQAASGPAFLLGPTKKAARAGLVARAKRLGPEGVLLKTVGRDIALLGGGERGDLYAVYVFLERFVGCRFLARDCTVTPRKNVLTVPQTDYAYSPQFIYREALYHDAEDWRFAARQKLNGANMNHVLGLGFGGKKSVAAGVLIYPFVHSAAYMVPPATYFASHPEYFGLVGGKRIGEVISGQICYTNPDVLGICTEVTLKLLKEHPEIASVDISQNDSWPDRPGACECERCAAIVKEEGSQHGPILRFVNAVADAVAGKYPGKYVDTLAYSYSIATPKATRPRPNVIIRLCHYACYFHGIEGDPIGADYRKAVDDWRRAAKNLWVWHYGVNFWHYLAPNPNLVALANDIKYYASHGVNGLMLQGDIQSSGGELAEFRQYLASQLMWDPTQDPLAIRKDFCRGYYGPAAAEALEFMALMDEFGRTTTRHIPMNGWNPPDVTTPEFVSRGLAVLERAYARAGSDVCRNRVEKLMLPLWYMQFSWPDRYGLSTDAGRALLPRVKRVLEVNDITTISEGPPNARDFVARMEAAFGAPKAQR